MSDLSTGGTADSHGTSNRMPGSRVMGASHSPSPLPSPTGRGRRARRFSDLPGAPDLQTDWRRFSLSPGERAGVRGNGAYGNRTCLMIPPTVGLPESLGRAGGLQQ